MKPAQKPFVVEFKNRRRVPRKDVSIWGRIDLQPVGSEVPGEPATNGDIDAHLHEVTSVEAEAEITA